MPRADNYIGKPMQLTPRETEVMQWVACGKSSAEIAELMTLGVPTINTHIRKACLKLDAVNQKHAVAVSIIHGLLPIGPSSSLTIPLQTLFGLSKRSPDSKAMTAARQHAPQRFHSKKNKGSQNG